MGGEGSIQAMQTILQNNRKLLRKKSVFGEKSSINKSRIKLEFKQVEQECLEKLKRKIRKEAKKEQRRYRLAFVVISILVVIIFYFALKDFTVNFDLFLGKFN